MPSTAPLFPPLLPVAPARIYAGTSGWAYPTWKPGFYPEGVSAKNFLRFYSSQLNSVEVNYTFRELPTPEVISRWLDDTPEGFRFSFKAPQRITHFSRLRDCNAHLGEFFKMLAPVTKAGKMGLVLFQLPPNFKADIMLLRTFLAAPAFRKRNAPPIAFEFRHESWFCDETEALLARRNAAYCIAESDELVTPERHTAPAHTSFRLRRSRGYTGAEIAAFAARFRALADDDQQPREVYVYFKHEDEPTGALNARAFLRAAGGAATG